MTEWSHDHSVISPRRPAVPTPTFDNLPEDKRRRIADLAVAEFASRPYREASLNRIVARAGIAKGSIYQYFSGKLDLYRWVVTEELGRRKREAVLAAVPEGGDPKDLFEALERQYVAGLRLFLAHPRLARLGARLLDPAPDPAVRKLHDEARRAGIDWLRGALARAQERGEVRLDLDLDLAAHMIAQALGIGLTQALMARLGTDLDRFMARPIPKEKVSEIEVKKLARAAVDLLRRGVGTP